MSNFPNFAPHTTRGILLSTVSAIALTAGLSGPIGPDGGGSSIDPEIQRPAVTVNAPADSTMNDQNFTTGNDKPPKALHHPTTQERFVGHPNEIKGWTAKYFQPREFASKGNGLVDVDVFLVARLDAVREELGLPIRITSGYRDPAHNAHVNGAKNSQHMHGMAVDIDISGYDSATRYRLLILLVKHDSQALARTQIALRCFTLISASMPQSGITGRAHTPSGSPAHWMTLAGSVAQQQKRCN